MKFKKLTEKQDKFVEIVASFSAIAGKTFTARMGDGRMYSWLSDVHWADGNYWLNLIIDDEGDVNVLIKSGYVEDNAFYAAIGYCTYHDISFEIEE